LFILQIRYAGKQSTRGAAESSSGPTAPAPTAGPAPVSSAGLDLEQAIASQGDKVRELKTSKAAKADIDAAVAVLLDLKKQLVVSQGGDPGNAAAASKKGKKKK
jgi:hypothetical protein